MSNDDQNIRERKRARFSGTSRQRALVPVLAGVGFVLLVAAGVLLPRLGARGQAAQISDASRAANATVEQVAGQDDAVRLPLSTFDDGQAHFYTYQPDNGTAVRFFAIKSGDGVVRTAFDACDVCFPAHKGFHQEGDEMVCNNCGRRFPTTMIGQVSGGCNPAPLAGATEGGDLAIRTNDILAGVGYFQ